MNCGNSGADGPRPLASARVAVTGDANARADAGTGGGDSPQVRPAGRDGLGSRPRRPLGDAKELPGFRRKTAVPRWATKFEKRCRHFPAWRSSAGRHLIAFIDTHQGPQACRVLLASRANLEGVRGQPRELLLGEVPPSL